VYRSLAEVPSLNISACYSVAHRWNITFEGVNGFHLNMACFETPFKGFVSNVKLFKNSIGHLLKSAFKNHIESNFTNEKGLQLGDL